MDDIAMRLGRLTDKFQHGYYLTYKRLAGEIGPAGRVLEVGVELGGSLLMWQELFPDGLVVGVDHNEYATWPAGTVKVVSGQDDPRLPARARDISPEGYDLIVDDASHVGHLSKATYELLWSLVRPGRWYVMEDWAVGYLPGYVDHHGTGMLRFAESFLPKLGREPVPKETPHPGWSLDCQDDQLTDLDYAEYRWSLMLLHKRAS